MNLILQSRNFPHFPLPRPADCLLLQRQTSPTALALVKNEQLSDDMNVASLNNLWSYLQGLTLTPSNKKWLADHLYEAAKADAETSHASAQEYSVAQRATLEKARALTQEQMHVMETQEFLSPDDLKLLLYRTVDDIYSQA